MQTHSCGGVIRSKSDVWDATHLRQPVPTTPTPAALGGERIAAIYIHSPHFGPRPGFCFPRRARTRKADQARRLCRSAQLLQPGRPYGNHIAATALPARLGASCDGQPALSLCARGSRNGTARRYGALNPADQSERRTRDARMRRNHGTGEILQSR